VAGRRRLHLRLDPAALLRRQVADLQKGVDEEAQAHLRGQAAGAGVGRVDQAGVLQVGHDVPDGGRRQRHRQNPRDIARSHRLARDEVGFDDLPEDLARALVQLRGRAVLGA
jgi:hypothetical protein